MDCTRERWWYRWGRGAVLALLAFQLSSSAALIFSAQATDQLGTDQIITEQTVYDYITQQLGVNTQTKDQMKFCARNQFNSGYKSKRVEPAVFLAFLQRLNTDNRLGAFEKQVVLQKIYSPIGVASSGPCDNSQPPLLWPILTVYEQLSFPTTNPEQLTTLVTKLASWLEARKQAEAEVMAVLQKVGVAPGLTVPNAPAPSMIDALLRDIPVGQISKGLEEYVVGNRSATSTKEAAMQAIRANEAIPPQSPTTGTAGPQLDPGWLTALTAKVDSVDASEWNRVVQNTCQRLRQIGQPVVKCN